MPPPSTGPSSGASIEFLSVGVDGPAADATRERIFTFDSNSPGIVEASAEAGGPDSVRLCLGRGAPGSVTAQQCRESTDVEVASVATGVETTWTVTLTGAEGAGAFVDLVLRFPSDAPSVTIDGFRFQGTAFEDYNGFAAEVLASGGGSLAVDATWSGGPAPYRLRFTDARTTLDDSTGEGSKVTGTVAVGTDGLYGIRLGNQQEFAEQDYTLRATVSWP